MCLPLSFVKLLVRWAAGLTIVIGCSIAIAASINLVMAQSEDNVSGQLDFIIILFIASLFLILGGIFGIIGEQKKITLCLAIYNLLLFCNIGVFIFFCVIFLSISTFYRNIKPDECSTTFDELDEIVSLAQEQFCKDDCPCYISNESAWPANYFSLNNLNITNNSTDPINYFEFNDSVNNWYKYHLTKLEETENCAGWCEGSPVYLFSDVNQLVPKQNNALSNQRTWNQSTPDDSQGCFFIFINKQQHSNSLYGYLTLFISVLLVAIALISCCLCFHPERTQSQVKFYSFINYDKILKKKQFS